MDERWDWDRSDPRQYCQHGTFIGSWWGPDLLCRWCEDGSSWDEFLIDTNWDEIAALRDLLLGQIVRLHMDLLTSIHSTMGKRNQFWLIETVTDEAIRRVLIQVKAKEEAAKVAQYLGES